MLTFGAIVILVTVVAAVVGASAPSGSPETPPEPPADRRLATEAEIATVVDDHGQLLYRIAFSITHDRALAEDVVQDALFQAWTSMPSWEGDVPVRWLRRVTHNRAISVMRKQNRSTPADDWEDQPSRGADIERVVEGRELMSAVRRALALLDERARMMIVLRETQELSYEEIAEILDLTPAAVKTRLYRARHTLKQCLRDWELR